MVHESQYHSPLSAHLLLKQHKIPVLPRNQQQPKKRISDRHAVVHSKAWKKWLVRVFALDCDAVSIVSIHEGWS